MSTHHFLHMKQNKFIHFGGLSGLNQEHYEASSESFHNPPCKKGLYAFPERYIDRFLIGSTNYVGHISNKSSWLKDDGNMVEVDWNDYDKDFKIISKKILYLIKKNGTQQKYVYYQRKDKDKLNRFQKDNKDKTNDCGVECENCIVKTECENLQNEPFYYNYLKKPKIFEYDGEIWHHLGEHLNPHQIIEIKKSWVKTSFSDYLLALSKEKHKALKDLHKEMRYFGDFNGNMLSRTDPFAKSPAGIEFT